MYPLLARADRGEKTCTCFNALLWDTLSTDIEKEIEGVIGWLPRDEELVRAHRVVNPIIATKATKGAAGRAARRSREEGPRHDNMIVGTQAANSAAVRAARRSDEERLRRANGGIAAQVAPPEPRGARSMRER